MQSEANPNMAATDIAIRDMEDGDREAVIDLIWQLNRFEDAISHDRAPQRLSLIHI